jgi:hypothetical protein
VRFAFVAVKQPQDKEMEMKGGWLQEVSLEVAVRRTGQGPDDLISILSALPRPEKV